MSQTQLSEIHGFDSLQHYQAFTRDIEAMILKGELAPAPVQQIYGSEMFDETWYRSTHGETWRLVSPEFPFKGVFERVAKS